MLAAQEELPAAEVEAQEEEPGRLDVAPGVDGPEEAGLLSRQEVVAHEMEEISLLRVCDRLAEECAHAQIGGPVGGVDGPGRVVEPLDGLQQEEYSQPQHHLVAAVAHQEENDAYGGEEQQHVASHEEYRVERCEAHKQEQPPEESVPEVASLPPLVAPLHVEREPEEQGEDGVGFAGHQGEDTAEDAAVQPGEPVGLVGGVDVEVEVLDAVDQQNRHDGKAAQGIDHLDAGLFCGLLRVHFMRMVSGVFRRAGFGDKSTKKTGFPAFRPTGKSKKMLYLFSIHTNPNYPLPQ